MDRSNLLTPDNAIAFLNAAFDRLSLAEAADKSHRLDDAITNYDAFLQHVNVFLSSPACALYADAVNAGELRAMLPGVQLRLQRLTKMRTLRDKPPVPGAIPLTGPAAAASVAPESAHALAGRAAAAAAAAAATATTAGTSPTTAPAAMAAPGTATAAPTASGAAAEAAPSGNTAEQQLAAELLRVAAERRPAGGSGDADRSCDGDGGGSSGSKSSGVQRDANRDREGVSGPEGGADAAAATAQARGPNPDGDNHCCANCGAPGRWRDGTAANAAAPATATAAERAPMAGSSSAAADSEVGCLSSPPPPLLRCGRCRAVLYCSAGCQRAHWPKHKAVCRGG